MQSDFVKEVPVSDLNKMIGKNKTNQMIHLELMKKHSGSLAKFIEELSLGETIKLIRHVICIQLELFCTYGLTHGDIHLGNYLTEKSDKLPIEFSFCGELLRYALHISGVQSLSSADAPVRSKLKTISSPVNLYLTDFEHSIIYLQRLNGKIKPYLTNGSVLVFSNTIGFNLLNTFTEFIGLIADVNLAHELSNKLTQWEKANVNINESNFVKPLREYASNVTFEHLFISKGFTHGLFIVKELFRLLFNVDF